MLSIALAFFFAAAQPPAKQWIDTAEAYFVTNAERQEWARLGSEGEKAKFIERYWLKRDPTPDTPKNEFRDAIMERILRADAKYRFEDTRGSETARGYVFVVFGPPSRFRSATADPATSQRTDVSSQTAATAAGATEAGESYETWIYDRERTPRLLEMVGLPSLTFDFVIRPQKHIDELQSPGLASELRERLAGRSIVTPAAGLPAAAATPATSMTRLDASLPDAVAHSLDDAPPPSFASPFGYFGMSSRWSAQGQPEVVVWFAATPQAKTNLSEAARFVGRIARADGSVAGTFSEPLRTTSALRSWGGGSVSAAKLTLPAGDYTGAFAVADNGQIVTDAMLSFHVADGASAFAASSILLSATPERAAGGMFDIGKLGVVPRADQTFSKTESLWYSGEVVNPTDPQKVTIDVRLRSGAKALGASQVALESESVGPHRYFYVREMPLAAFEPGDYTLYVTVRDPSGATDVRRADFRIVP
jgi:GWxTD domain-containing protein